MCNLRLKITISQVGKIIKYFALMSPLSLKMESVKSNFHLVSKHRLNRSEFRTLDTRHRKLK